jgi:O-antigen/teichoic acid export membrane protein
VGSGKGRHAKPPDQVYRSSFFLLASAAVTAGLGFVFWVLVARFYTPAQVGVATSLISAINLIAYLGLFGLNSTLIRFPAPGAARNGQISQAILFVTAASCTVAAVYLLGLPLYGHKLLFVRDQLPLAAAFVVFSACAAVNQLTDSVFISARLSQYNTLVDGVIQGLVKLALPAALTGLGAVGIVGASSGGFAVAAAVSLLLMRRTLGFRFDLRSRGTRLRENAGFTMANYASSLLNLAPLMATPLIVLQRLGEAAAGYYYVAFQIANLLNAVSFSVGEAVFAEASHDMSRFPALLRRSAAIMAGTQVPAAAVVALSGGLVLRLFGATYAAHARTLLVVLAVGALTVALNTWASFMIKVANLMGALVFSNVVYAVVIIGCGYAWAPRGLVWLGWAWCAGNTASGLVAVVGGLVGRRRQRRAAAARRAAEEAERLPRVPGWAAHPPEQRWEARA